MNPSATKSIPEYAYGKCCGDLEQARVERRFLRVLLALANQGDPATAAAIQNVWLPKSRRNINLLSARKTRLRRKLEAFKATQDQATETLRSKVSSR